MAHELILLRRGSEADARRILDAFSERTGLRGEPVAAGMRYALEGPDHRVKIVETLNDIEGNWERHISLGQPDDDDR
jgi:hypothetical protein